MKNYFLTILLFVSLSTLAAGPIGYGGIKIGMNKSAIEKISSAESVHIVGDLTPYEYKNGETPIDREDKYKGLIKTPLAEQPLSTDLTFTDDKLTFIYIRVPNESMLNSAKSQISEKYGKPIAKEEKKEEQCIYRNGNSFNLSGGYFSYTWEMKEKGRVVKTDVSKFITTMCPSDLRYGTTDQIKIMSISFELEQVKKPKAQNSF